MNDQPFTVAEFRERIASILQGPPQLDKNGKPKFPNSVPECCLRKTKPAIEEEAKLQRFVVTECVDYYVDAPTKELAIQKFLESDITDFECDIRDRIVMEDETQ